MLDILIAEDNKEIGILLCDFLRKENYTVSVAQTGEKALELYEKYGARVIAMNVNRLTDIILCRMMISLFSRYIWRKNQPENAIPEPCFFI